MQVNLRLSIPPHLLLIVMTTCRRYQSSDIHRKPAFTSSDYPCTYIVTVLTTTSSSLQVSSGIMNYITPS
jgi:hypothetical protein